MMEFWRQKVLGFSEAAGAATEGVRAKVQIAGGERWY